MTNDKVQAYLDRYDAVASEIARLTGWKATVEDDRSAYIDVQVPDGSVWYVGDAVETWGADYYADQAAVQAGISCAQVETDVPARTPVDPTVIATSVVAAIWTKRRDLLLARQADSVCAKCGRPRGEHIYGDGTTFVGVHGCEFERTAR